MTRRLYAAALLAALLTSSACASGLALREPALSAPNASPEAANARRFADALLARAGAADLFENISQPDAPTVRHRRSGLVCRFNEKTPGQGISVFPQPLPRGDDIGCQLSSDLSQGSHTLYASKVPGVTTLQQALGGSVYLMRRQYPDLKPFEGPNADVALQRDDLRPPPPSLTARFLATIDGRPHLTRVSVALVNGWTIKQRYTVPVGEDPQQAAIGADLAAGLFWADTLMRFTNGDALDRPPPMPVRPPVGAGA